MKNTRSLSNEHPDGNRPGGFFFLLLKYFDYDGHAEHDVNEENQTTATKKYRLRTMRISIFFLFLHLYVNGQRALTAVTINLNLISRNLHGKKIKKKNAVIRLYNIILLTDAYVRADKSKRIRNTGWVPREMPIIYTVYIIRGYLYCKRNSCTCKYQRILARLTVYTVSDIILYERMFIKKK